ncbi:MAG: helix-turn-helix transcriptional regulator [Leptospirales bacterium]|nr:helix-turn-helix transcriptional regulator [Leptospirales bacterium]
MQYSPGSIILLCFGLFGSGLAIGVMVWQILRGERALHNLLMGIALISGCWWILMGGLVFSGLASQYPALFTSDIALIYFIGPSMYAAFHLRSGFWQAEWRHLLHGTPGFIALLIVLPAMFADSEFKRMVLDVTYSVKFPRDFIQLADISSWSARSYAYLLVLIKVGAKLSMMAYLVLIIRRAAHLVVRPAGPRTVFALRVYCGLGIVAAFVSLMSHFAGIVGAGLAVLVGTIAIVGVQVLDGIFSLFHKQEDIPLPAREAISERAGNKQARAVGLDVDSILERLQDLMEKELLYCDEDLSLAILASHLEIRADQLSYILNQHCNQNFYSYVNGYRVAEARKLLAGNASIAFISQSVGFNSQQVFTAVFRRFEGVSPGKFREILKANSAGGH